MAIKQHFGILSNKHPLLLLPPLSTSSTNPGCFQATDEALNIINYVSQALNCMIVFTDILSLLPPAASWTMKRPEESTLVEKF